MDPLAARSPLLLRCFDHIFARTARRHMCALRLAGWGAPQAGSGPLVIFASHASWWDGIAFLLLSRRLFPGRRVFVPVQAAALARYPFMRWLGAFGVTLRDPAGFLGTAGRVLQQDMLWMNAGGRFADVRQRPVPIAAGLVRLAGQVPQVQFLPLALEYPFWTERRPEMLAAFGPPLSGAALQAMPPAARQAALEQALAATMDRLAADAMARDPAAFRVLIEGRQGMGGIYDFWRRLRATLAGRRFDPRHAPQPPEAPGRTAADRPGAAASGAVGHRGAHAGSHGGAQPEGHR